MGCGAALQHKQAVKERDEQLRAVHEELRASQEVGAVHEESAVSLRKLAADLQSRWAVTATGMEQEHAKAHQLFREELQASRDITHQQALDSRSELAHHEQEMQGQLERAKHSNEEFARGLELAAAAQIRDGAERAESVECAERTARDAEIAEARKLYSELSQLRRDCSAELASARGEAKGLQGQLNALQGEHDVALATLTETRESLWAEQAERKTLVNKASLLQRQLTKTQEEHSCSEQICLQLQAEVQDEQAECRDVLRQRNESRRAHGQAVRSREQALMSASEEYDDAMHEWGEALLCRDEALQAYKTELAESWRDVSSLEKGLKDASRQLQTDHEQIKKLQELVSLCARSGATRAAAAYWQCSSGPRLQM